MNEDGLSSRSVRAAAPMPELSRFFGIIIRMHYNDHAPPHFHAHYGDRSATIALVPLRVLEGMLPPRVLGFVMEWGALHQRELMENWTRARSELPLRRIDPLQ